MTPLRDWIWRGARADALRASLVLGPGLRIADLGCGQGELGELLGLGRIEGFDADPEQIAAARARPRPGMRFEEADAGSVPRPDGSFDRVVCQALLVHLSRPEAVVEEMARLVKAGGLVALIEPDLLAAPCAEGELGALQRERRERASREAKRAGLGSWAVADELDVLAERAGLRPVARWREEGRWCLAPPYDDGMDELRQRLLSLVEGEEAEATTLRWLAGEDGMEAEALRRLAELEAERREARVTGLRRGTWQELGAYPMGVLVARAVPRTGAGSL